MQVEEAATQFGAGLVQQGIETGQDSFVGIYSRNCPEVSTPHTLEPHLLLSLSPLPLSSLSAVGGD